MTKLVLPVRRKVTEAPTPVTTISGVQTVYHGTGAIFQDDQPKATTGAACGSGAQFWVTTEISIAQMYQQGEDPRIIEFQVNVDGLYQSGATFALKPQDMGKLVYIRTHKG